MCKLNLGSKQSVISLQPQPSGDEIELAPLPASPTIVRARGAPGSRGPPGSFGRNLISARPPNPYTSRSARASSSHKCTYVHIASVSGPQGRDIPNAVKHSFIKEVAKNFLKKARHLALYISVVEETTPKVRLACSL